MKTAIAAALLLIALSGFASAEPLYPDAILFGPSYVSGPPAGFPWWDMPNPGDPIRILGIASGVGAPFTDLLPVGPYELTFVYENATCTGTGMWDDLVCKGGQFADYASGSVAFYLDVQPDADFAVPATFRDGELVLTLAQVWDFHVMDDDPCSGGPMMPDYPDVFGSFQFTGGSWFARVSDNGAGFPASFAGEINSQEEVPAPLAALGYVLRTEGDIDIFGPVATRPVTWGHVKALYR